MKTDYTVEHAETRPVPMTLAYRVQGPDGFVALTHDEATAQRIAAALALSRLAGPSLTVKEGERLGRLRARGDILIARLKDRDSPEIRAELSAIVWAHNKICEMCCASGLVILNPLAAGPGDGDSLLPLQRYTFEPVPGGGYQFTTTTDGLWVMAKDVAKLEASYRRAKALLAAATISRDAPVAPGMMSEAENRSGLADRERTASSGKPDQHKCAELGHVWVGTGDDRVVCDDCGIERKSLLGATGERKS